MHSIQGIPLLACSESERVCRNACGVQLQTQSISMTVQLKWGVMNEIRLGLGFADSLSAAQPLDYDPHAYQAHVSYCSKHSQLALQQ